MKHELPKPADFTAADLVSRTGDRFNLPALTNFIGSLQSAQCVLGIQHLTFPPFSHGDTVIGRLTVNGTCIGLAGIPVTFVWRPDAVVRSCRVGDFRLESRTAMGVQQQTVYVELVIGNSAASAKKAALSIMTGGGVVRSDGGWRTPYSPKEGPTISVTPWEGTPPAESLVQNKRSSLTGGAGILYSSRSSEAFSLQATFPSPVRIENGRLYLDIDVPAGAERRVHFLIATGGDQDQLLDSYAEWCADPDAGFRAAASDWESEIAAVFTPGNDRYSGHLPVLKTTNADLRRLYLTAIIGVVYFKRVHPLSSYGRTYTTLMPRYWVTTSFINDWSLSAYLLAMLDPDCVRKMVELWLGRDVHSHFGTEYVSGDNAGNWYSCNDFAIVRLVTAYLKVTGDVAWIECPVGDRTVLEHVVDLATHYRSLCLNSRLADYGDRNSLLEAVGSYTNEVASLNAANVWMLREVAALLQTLGRGDEGRALRDEADELVPEILSLYVDGAGFWNCRRPDGSMVPVRHAWDFAHVMTLIGGDIGELRRSEMVNFFSRELKTRAWMSALSALDDDVDFSLRPDHQWNGSYPGWVALAARALFAAGRTDLLNEWLPGLAATARQGPFSQAHFVESYAPALPDGGAVKAPTEWPYINDWAILCVGGFFELVLLDLFGLRPNYESVDANPCLEEFDRRARLENVIAAGRLFSVDVDGAHEQRKAL